MVLFFIATTLFNDIKDVDKKVFSTQMNENTKVLVEDVEESIPKFKLLDTTY